MFKNFEILTQAVTNARRRGMKVSRAATRLGLDSETAKVVSVASEMEFIENKDETAFCAAVARGNSCMTGTPESYLYWARAQTEDGFRPVAVAVYRQSRCLVRLDTREFVWCYGENHGELQRALVFLGFKWNKEALVDLELPNKIVKGTYTHYKGLKYIRNNFYSFSIWREAAPKWCDQFETAESKARNGHYMDVENAPRIATQASLVVCTHYDTEVVQDFEIRPYIIPKPYCDGRRIHL